MALGAEDMETAGFDDGVVFDLGGGGVLFDGLIPLLLGDFELLGLIHEAYEAGSGDRRDGAFCGGDGACEIALDDVLLGHELGVAAEKDVGAAACHVGGDRYHAETSGLRDDFGFLLVELRVENDVADAFFLEDV